MYICFLLQYEDQAREMEPLKEIHPDNMWLEFCPYTQTILRRGRGMEFCEPIDFF